MLLTELLDIKNSCCLLGINPFLLITPFLEYGVTKDKSVVFGSYRTGDGIINCIFKKKPHSKESRGILGKICKPDGSYLFINLNRTKSDGVINDSPMPAKFRWPDKNEATGIKVDIDLGSRLHMTIVPRRSVETLLNLHKNSVRNTEAIMQIKEQVAADDLLPANSKIIATTTLRAALPNQYANKINHLAKWTIKAVQYKNNRLALLGSPDPGWYRFKPLLDIEILSKNQWVSRAVFDLMRIDNYGLSIPDISIPQYTTTHLMLCGPTEQMMDFRVNMVRYFVDKLLPDKTCLALVPCYAELPLYFSDADNEWLVISRFKNKELKLHIVKPPTKEGPLSECLKPVTITEDILELLKNSKTEIFIQDPSTTKEKLLEEIAIEYALNMI